MTAKTGDFCLLVVQLLWPWLKLTSYMMDGLISQLVLTGMHEHLKYGRVS